VGRTLLSVAFDFVLDFRFLIFESKTNDRYEQGELAGAPSFFRVLCERGWGF
jgi:hypothetical protein